MNIRTMPVVSSSDIEKEFNIRVFDCEFTQMAENDSYVALCLDEDRTYELLADVQYYRYKGEDAYAKRLKNELDLINKFRDLGYTDSILVFVSW